jgi:hypothetical protein
MHCEYDSKLISVTRLYLVTNYIFASNINFSWQGIGRIYVVHLKSTSIIIRIQQFYQLCIYIYIKLYFVFPGTKNPDGWIIPS